MKKFPKILNALFAKRGIKSQVDTKLEKLEKIDTGVRVTGKTSKGEAVSLEAEMLLGLCRSHALYGRIGT